MANNEIKNMENVNETNEVVETTEVKKDETLDISSLLKANREEVPKKKSALEEAKEARETNGLGAIVNTEDLKKDAEPKKLIANKSEDDAMHDADEYLSEMDKLTEAARKVNIKNPPKDALEMVNMMGALDTMAKTGSLPEVADGEKQMLETVEETAERIKNGEEVFTNDTVENVPENINTESNIEREKIINIVIDKTGMGGDFAFTDDEKEKIASSTEIRVKEVEEVDLSTITVRKKDKSFLESVNEFQISSSKVPVVFPASRFRAYMTGLSYGEMGDISLNSENVTFDQIHKKLTVIYNKMINPSVGKFENFEDFLKKFAYIDIDIAVYGLVVATFPELDDIPLNCNNKKCGKSFNHKFSPRALLRLDKSNDNLLQAMQSVIECKEIDATELLESSPTRSHKRIKLPYSGFIIEIGIGDKFKENHPNDVNGILQLNSALLSLIRGVLVPDGGEYVLYDDFEDMINALYMIKPEEIAILSALLQKYTDSYTVHFELTGIQCPHCGTKTRRIPIDINDLVFLKYQRLMSTELNIDNIAIL